MKKFFLYVLCLVALWAFAGCGRAEESKTRCDQCDEIISREDAYCRYCGEKVEHDAQRQPKAAAKVYISNRAADESGYSASDLTAAKKLTETYIAIFRSNTVMEKVQEKLSFSISVSELRESMEFTTLDDTEIINIEVFADEKEKADEILSCFLEAAPEQIANIIEGSSCRIVEVN